MKCTRDVIAAATAMTLGLAGCIGGFVTTDETQEEAGLGTATLALARVPSDAKCLRIDIEGSSRKVTRLLGLNQGESAVYRMQGLPVGLVSVKGDAFSAACAAVYPNSTPTWYSEPRSVQIRADQTVHITLEMIRNGRAAVAVDFDGSNNASVEPSQAEPAFVVSSSSSYLVPVAEGVVAKAVLTVGDSPNAKPDGTPYRMVGIPDGLGAFDNGDGTFTLLSTHELTDAVGMARAHGAKGAFVSSWMVRKSDLAVLHGQDLITHVVLWNTTTSSYDAPSTGLAFSRFCSADLPQISAFYDAVSDLGYDGRIFTTGEESGVEGRAVAHLPDGTTYQLPRLGRMSFENSVANPGTGVKTVVMATDDGMGGQVYAYVGTKTNTGSPVERAGLTNGNLFGIHVTGFTSEDPATGIPSGTPFTLSSMGNVENSTGAALEAASVAAGMTSFQRPEDGAWDPSNPNDFYFVTTASFTGSSRLWRLRFIDAANPGLGGNIDMLLEGSEGQKSMDNIVVDRRGHVIIEEDVGGNDHLGRILRYDIATDSLVTLLEHDPARFAPGTAAFLTRDEEASGVIDASDLLGDGWYLTAVQAHYALGGELVEGGQYVAFFDPGSR